MFKNPFRQSKVKAEEERVEKAARDQVAKGFEESMKRLREKIEAVQAGVTGNAE